MLRFLAAQSAGQPTTDEAITLDPLRDICIHDLPAPRL